MLDLKPLLSHFTTGAPARLGMVSLLGLFVPLSSLPAQLDEGLWRGSSPRSAASLSPSRVPSLLLYWTLSKDFFLLCCRPVTRTGCKRAHTAGPAVWAAPRSCLWDTLGARKGPRSPSWLSQPQPGFNPMSNSSCLYLPVGVYVYVLPNTESKIVPKL
jgi:hypothetical protein